MNCRYAGDDKPRMVKDRHDDACPGEGCKGCQPCERDHCFVQWHDDDGDCETHAATVCPSCVAKVREHLTTLVELAGYPLLEQALAEGDTDDEVANLLGPTANPAQWRQRSNYGHIYEPDSRLGWHTHPEGVLGWFDMLITEHLGHQRSGKITITSAADYIDRNLHFLAADVEFDFNDLAVALRDCRRHVERVLHAGDQIERGAPCMTCRKPLTRIYAGRELPWKNRDGSRSPAAEDGWACGRCRESRSEAEYRLNVADEHRKEADWLGTADMIERTGVTRGSLTGWASKGLVKKRTQSGRVVYRVADVKKQQTGDDAA